MAGKSSILVERHGEGVAVVTINRPHKRNALDMAAWRDLGDAFHSLNADPTVRAIVLTGAGGAFCAGDDIQAFASVKDKPAERQKYWDTIMEAYAQVTGSKVPVIAAVSGPCVGGGCTLALRADFRIADRTARFGAPPAKLGLVYPADSTQLLVLIAGYTMAKHMLYTGDIVDARAAETCGMVSRVVDGSVVDAAIEYVRPMTENAPISIEAAKIACDAAMGGRAREVADQVHQLSLKADASEDYREGVRAFFEKRRPRFTGR
ncbi:MAG: enoyl-CoA hydratase/isomerase family protein [Ideonella sp.]|nr:enoyl-CoA hydratase/isomerase family protein [Ideonella sp.]